MLRTRRSLRCRPTKLIPRFHRRCLAWFPRSWFLRVRRSKSARSWLVSEVALVLRPPLPPRPPSLPRLRLRLRLLPLRRLLRLQRLLLPLEQLRLDLSFHPSYVD